MLEQRAETFAGLAATRLTSGATTMIVVHEIGPRIAWFGRRESFLYWDADGRHRRGTWHLRGGHRLWVARPGADESEETYAPDDAACHVAREPGRLVVTAPPDAARIQKSLAVTVRGEAWIITHSLRNTGDMLWAGGAWGLTCSRPDPATHYEVPLDGGPAGWDVLTVVIPRRWGGDHTARVVDPQIQFTESAILVRPDGNEGKRMVSAPRGTLVMRDPQRGCFTKSAPYELGAAYPCGTNVAFYLAPRAFMVELETMSPMRTLYPGQALEHVETWTAT